MIVETMEGTFVREYKNRFLCIVRLNGTEVECYVPSSSRLQNFLELKERKVLLTKNKSQKGRTEFSLFAADYDGQYVLLNLNKINGFVKDLIASQQIYSNNNFEILSERTLFHDYKMDLYLIDKKESIEIVLEVKGVLSIQKEVIFPYVDSVRSIEQLKKIKTLLLEGKNVHYLLVTLSPFVNEIKLNPESEFTRLLNECVKVGLKLKAIRLQYDGTNLYHDNLIKII